jgi:hypothetical protein
MELRICEERVEDVGKTGKERKRERGDVKL